MLTKQKRFVKIEKSPQERGKTKKALILEN